MKTAIVILNWNTRDYLERFLPPLLESTKGLDASVTVADNGSDDGSAELLRTRFPDVRTILFDRNHGFTGGYDMALSQVESEYYVLLNSDIEVPPHWLEPLVEWMDTHPDCGACGPKLLSYGNRDMFEYAGAAGGLLDAMGYPFCRGRIPGMVEKDAGQYDSPAPVLWVSGACLMVRSSVFRALGGLDDRFFAHMEEIDLCWRMQLRGWKVWVVPSSKVYHIGGGTLPQTSPWKLKLNFRNNLLMLQNNLPSTIALALLKDGHKAQEAARLGIRKATRLIFRRKILDGLACCVYICTGRWSLVKAVADAHREFSSLGRTPSAQEVENLLGECPGAVVHGLYGGWIIPGAVFRRKKTLKTIRSL